MSLPTGADMLAVALAAVDRGWRVFPLRPGAKRPALHGYDRCPRTRACEQGHQGWEQRATTDPERIRAAWSTGAFNVGVATGPSGLVVVDLDAAKPGQTPPPPWSDVGGIRNGYDVLAALAAQSGHPTPTDTFTVATPSGGMHLYFTAPEDTALRNTAGTLGWKIDTRAHGGYVVGPGSVVEGRPYRIVCDTDPAPLPDWVAEQLRPAPLPTAPACPRPVGATRRARYLDAAIAAECDKVHHAPASQRNSTLFVAAVALGQLAAGGALSEHEVEDALLHAAARHIALGAYSEPQARATIRSGIRKGANRPRQVA